MDLVRVIILEGVNSSFSSINTYPNFFRWSQLPLVIAKNRQTTQSVKLPQFLVT